MAKLTKKQIILNYVEKHKEPMQKLCPIIVLYWTFGPKNDQQKKWWRSDTGEITITSENTYTNQEITDSIISKQSKRKRYERYNQRSVGSRHEYVYTHYDEKFQVLEITTVRLKGRRYEKGEVGVWKYGDYGLDYGYGAKRVFIFKGDVTPYGENGEPIWTQYNGKYYNLRFPEWLSKTLQHLNTMPVASDEFKKYAGCNTFRHSRWSDCLEAPWAWASYYKKTAPRPTTKKQANINEILNVPLTDLSELEKRYPLIATATERCYWSGGTYTDYDIERKDYYHFEIINDDYCVIRYLEREYSGRYGYNAHINEHFREPVRIYIDSKGNVSVTSYSEVNHVYQIIGSQLSTVTDTYSNTIFGNLEEIKNWKRLSWIEDTVINLKEVNKAAVIVTILRHPVVELLYKAGYHNLAEAVMDDNKVAHNINAIFGVKEKKKGSITKILGVNKQTLKWLDDNIIVNRDSYTRVYYNREIKMLISTIKEIFNVDDISSWSQESIDTYFTPTLAVLRKSHNWKRILLPTHQVYRWGGDKYNLTDTDRRHIQHILRMGYKDIQILEIYMDIIQTYHCLNTEYEPDLESVYSINNLVDMNHFHDAIVALYNQQLAEQRARWDMQEAERIKQDQKRFEKLQDERREKYNYSNDEDNFIIKIPEALSEITMEGQTLGHCVSGYVSRHANGDTNILFLRKKDIPNIPLFTIEVKHDTVIQLHGKNNRWLCSENTDAVGFMVKWLKKTGIHCDRHILLETSKGYGASGRLVDGTPFGL